MRSIYAASSVLALALAAPARTATAAGVQRLEADVVIGASLPLTGSEARTGQAFQEGYQLAVEQVSGLLSEPQSKIAEREHIPYVHGGSAAEIHDQGYRFVFGLLSPIKLLAGAYENWLTENQVAGKLANPARVAMAWEDTARGREYHSMLVAALRRSKGHYEIVSEQSFALNTKDARGVIARLEAARADLFLAERRLVGRAARHRWAQPAVRLRLPQQVPPRAGVDARARLRDGARPPGRHREGGHQGSRRGPGEARRPAHPVDCAGRPGELPRRVRPAGPLSLPAPAEPAQSAERDHLPGVPGHRQGGPSSDCRRP